jgi:hypothetical protein
MMTPLQLPQVGEERCDFTAGVLIDPMQAYEGIEYQQAGLERIDRVREPIPISRQIQARQ